jgi:putative membrane protein
MLRLALAVLHLLALGIGLGSVYARARALGEVPLTPASAKRAFTADSWWGAAAVLWISTGLWRLLGGTEKATTYYVNNHLFFAKMGFFALILVLEIVAMVSLMRWRSAARRAGSGWHPEDTTAARVKVISYIEVVLLIAMLVAAVSMARGYGARV